MNEQTTLGYIFMAVYFFMAVYSCKLNLILTQKCFLDRLIIIIGFV